MSGHTVCNSNDALGLTVTWSWVTLSQISLGQMATVLLACFGMLTAFMWLSAWRRRSICARYIWGWYMDHDIVARDIVQICNYPRVVRCRTGIHPPLGLRAGLRARSVGAGTRGCRNGRREVPRRPTDYHHSSIPPTTLPTQHQTPKSDYRRAHFTGTLGVSGRLAWRTAPRRTVTSM